MKALYCTLILFHTFLSVSTFKRSVISVHRNIRVPKCDIYNPIKLILDYYGEKGMKSFTVMNMYQGEFDDDDDDTKPDLILDDFDQILEGISVFKRVFGDLEISNKFEVPGTDSWPSHLHGLRLGKRLEKILSTREFFQLHPDKVNSLKKLGFEPKASSLVDDWSMIYQALKVYKQVYGDLRVPAKFEVPNDEPWPRLSRKMKLGVRVAAMRSAGRYVKDRRERKSELDALGFEWRLRDHTHKQQLVDDLFEQVYAALLYYKNTVNEDMNVPLNFQVPEDSSWPVETWGLKLGSIVQSIREKDKLVFGHSEREKRLNELGFSLEESKREQYSKKRFEVVYRTLVKYKELFGDLMVPQAFVVPKEEPWDEDMWGLKLGARVNAIRAQGTLVTNSPERREKLESLGFIWELPNQKKKKRNKSVGDKDDDDESDFDLELGDDVDIDLDADGFNEKSIFDKKKDAKQRLESAFQIQSQIEVTNRFEASEVELNAKNRKYSNRITSFPSRFTSEYNVPLRFDPARMFEPLAYREVSAETLREYMNAREYSDDPDIRQISHFEGYLSAENFHKINIREIEQEDISDMKRIGYRIVEFGQFNWDIVFEAIQIYKQNFGNFDVPIDYVINDAIIESNIGFSDRFDGMNLGDAVEAIRIGDVDGFEDPIRRQQLDDIGFTWGDMNKYHRFRFYPMVLGLKVYRHLFGSPFPQYNFLVPDEVQWPYWMCGMPLGEWTAVCRVQQKMIEEYYPKRRDVLNAMDFIWWIPPGPIPEKYYESLSV